MTDGESLSSWLRLTLIPGIGGETQRKLLAAFGLPEAVFSSSHSALRDLIGDRLTRLLLDTGNEEAVASACAWSKGQDRRKHFAGSALFTEAGDLFAFSEQTWIQIDAHAPPKEL